MRRILILTIALTSGCSLGRGPLPPQQNPLPVPVQDREMVWNQIVDTVDNYFRITEEVRVEQRGDTILQGRIETHPKIAATSLEPWRRDGEIGPERRMATAQTIRRRAQVIVIPDGGGYLIDVRVYKELEDVDQPEHSTVGNATLRHDMTTGRNRRQAINGPITLGWIPVGRDTSLEQRILAEINTRLMGGEGIERLPLVGP